MNFEPRCDLFKSPVDPRDWIAEEIYLTAIPIPETFDWRDELCVLPIRSQGTSSQCAAFSGAAIKETQELKESRSQGSSFHNNFSTKPSKCYFSPQYIYNQRYNKPANGMNTVDLMKIMKNGVLLEEDYPFAPNYREQRITAQQRKKALPYRIAGYARIETIEKTKEEIYMNGPVVFAVPTYTHNTMMWRPNGNKPGGHAMCLIGWTKDAFIVRNSWGANWGYDGYCYFPLADWGMQWEVWTTVDYVTANKIKPIEPTPRPEPPLPTPIPVPPQPKPKPTPKIFSRIQDLIKNLFKSWS